MSPEGPFVLIVAGPNGSGKTTLTTMLREQGYDFGEYINPDDIAQTLSGSYDERVREAQRIADRLREACVVESRSFSFETVMSHPSKLELLEQARNAGFQIILYFVATEDPDINIDRVRARVLTGGHEVPVGKIISRYERTLALLPEALALADDAYIFDNSRNKVSGGGGLRLVLRARKTAEGHETTLMSEPPGWFLRALGGA